MKTILVIILLNVIVVPGIQAQEASSKHEQEIYTLIDYYSMAREKRDTSLLKSILMPDIDQLVSSGEWRMGIQAALHGMLQSSAGNPGTRRLTIEYLRFLNSYCAIADARYDIQNTDSTERKMWSSFIVVYDKNSWKISAIRNMLPAPSR